MNVKHVIHNIQSLQLIPVLLDAHHLNIIMFQKR